MFAALQAVNVDWNVVAGAVATFIVTAVATAFGFRKGIMRIRQSKTEPTTIAAATLMDNMSMIMLTEAIKENTAIQRDCHSCMLQLLTIAQIGLKRS